MFKKFKILYSFYYFQSLKFLIFFIGVVIKNKKCIGNILLANVLLSQTQSEILD